MSWWLSVWICVGVSFHTSTLALFSCPLFRKAGATADTAAFALGLRIIKHSLWGGAPDSSQHEVGSGGDHGPTYLWVACDANLMDDDESRNPCVPKSSA